MSVITRDEQGNYRWSGVVDVGYEHKSLKIAFAVCGGICALYIVLSLIMGGEMLGVVLLSSAGVMAACGGVYWAFNRIAGTRKQKYLMTERGVEFKQRRYYAPFSFKSIRKAVVYPSRDMIELYQAMGSGPVFVPHEDFEFVKEFILQRLPPTAEVIFDR